jgi:hypothetical protein
VGCPEAAPKRGRRERSGIVTERKAEEPRGSKGPDDAFLYRFGYF